MKKTFKNLMIGAALLGMTSVVSAVPTLYISDGSSVQSFTGVNGITTSGSATLGVWTFVIATGLTKPVQGSAVAPSMDIAIQASSTAGGNLWIAYSDTGFTGNGAILATISGHIVSGAAESVGMTIYANTANILGGLNANGTASNAGSAIATVPVQGMPLLAYALGALPGTTPYTLTEIVTLSSQGPTSTSIDGGFNMVPDGGMTIAMLGLGLVAVEAARRIMVKA